MTYGILGYNLEMTLCCDAPFEIYETCGHSKSMKLIFTECSLLGSPLTIFSPQKLWIEMDWSPGFIIFVQKTSVGSFNKKSRTWMHKGKSWIDRLSRSFRRKKRARFSALLGTNPYPTWRKGKHIDSKVPAIVGNMLSSLEGKWAKLATCQLITSLPKGKWFPFQLPRILPPATTRLRIRHSPRSRELSEVNLMEPQVFRLHENTILNAQKLLRFLGYHDGI